MRSTRLLATIGLLACVVMPSIAQDQPAQPKDAPKVELMRVYKAAGASWSYRTVSWQREGDTYSGSESCTVESVTEGKASVRTQGRNKQGSRSWTRTETINTDSPFSDKADWVDAKLPRETLDLGFAKFPCAKSVEKLGDLQITRWVSTEWHPLVVKEVKLGAHSGETRTLTSFQTGEVDPWLLYRMKGRSWTMKSTTTIEGVDPIVSYMRTTIKEVSATKATLSMELQDKDKKPFEGVPASEYGIEFTATASAIAPAPAVPMWSETKKVEAGEFACQVWDYGTTKSWISSAWPGLVVVTEANSVRSELVEFDLGHDTWALYRTAGNSYTICSETSVAGQKLTSTMKYEVQSVEDNTATVVVTVPDMKMPVPANETKIEFKDKESPAMAYANQKEQWITTPAGSFPAILTEVEGSSKSWMWNGIPIRTETKTDQFETVMELTELKLE